MRLTSKQLKSLNESYISMNNSTLLEQSPVSPLSFLGNILNAYSAYLASSNKGPAGTLADLAKKSSMQAMVGPSAVGVSRIANIYKAQANRMNMNTDWYAKQYGALPQIY
jgi:hypothetical protein